MVRVRSPWSERKYYSGDVQLMSSHRESSPTSSVVSADISNSINSKGSRKQDTDNSDLTAVTIASSSSSSSTSFASSTPLLNFSQEQPLRSQQLPPTTPTTTYSATRGRSASPAPSRQRPGQLFSRRGRSKDPPAPKSTQAHHSQHNQQSNNGREPPPQSPPPATGPVSATRNLWAQRDRNATVAGLKASPSVRQKQERQPIQQPLRCNSDPNLCERSGNIASLSQTLNSQAEQLATMERDYLNLITNLEGEKRRITEMLDHRTQERDSFQNDIERLRRQLASKSNMSVAAEEVQMAQTEKITSLELEIQKCQEMIGQRDNLVASRNAELERMRQAVCTAAEEKLQLQEQARVEVERRDKFQSQRLEKAMTTMAEKDELIRQKEADIVDLRGEILNRKKERDDVKNELQSLQQDLEREKAALAKVKSAMAGYRLEIRRLEDLDREREENDAARSMEEEIRDEANATAAIEAKTKIAELSAVIETREGENEALSKQVGDLREQLQEESDKVTDLLGQISTLKADVEEAKLSTPDAVQKELEEQAEKISTLEFELSKKEDVIQAKADELQCLQEELSVTAKSNKYLFQELEETRTRLEDEIARADESRESFETMHSTAVTSLSKELEEANAERKAGIEVEKDLKNQIRHLEEKSNTSQTNEKTIQALYSELETSKAIVKDLEEECKVLKDRIQALDTERNEREAKYQETIAALKTELEETKANLEEEQKQNKGWKEYIESLEKEVSRQKEAVEAARELSANHFASAKVARRDAEDEMHRKSLDIANKLRKAEMDKNKLKDELVNKESLLTIKVDEVYGVKAMMKALEREKDALDAKLKLAEDKLAADNSSEAAVASREVASTPSGKNWRGEYSSENDAEEVEVIISAKNKVIEAKSNEVEALVADLKQCVDERDVMRSELQQLKENMEGKINALIDENQQLISERTSLKEELEESTGLKEEIGELKEQLVYESRRAYRMKKEIETLSASKDISNNMSTPPRHSRSLYYDSDSEETTTGIDTGENKQSFQGRLSVVMKETERKRERMNRIRERFGEATIGNCAANLQALQTALDEKDAQLQAKSAQVEKLEKLMEDLTVSHANQMAAAKESCALENDVSGFERTIDTLQKSIAEYESTIDKKSRDLEELQSTLCECTANKEELTVEVAELKELLDAESKRAAELLAGEKEARAEINRLESTIKIKEEEEARKLASDEEDKSVEIRELREQLIAESHHAFLLGKEMEQLRSLNENATEKIGRLENEAAKKMSKERNGNGPQGDENTSKIWRENEALKHEFQTVAQQLKNVTGENNVLKSELDLLRRKDSDAGRTSAVFSSRSTQPWQSPEKKKPWSSPPRLAPSKSDTPKVCFGESRDDTEDEASDRGQSRGDKRYEASSRSYSSSETGRNRNSTEVEEEITSLRQAINDLKAEKSRLEDSLSEKDDYIAELECKCNAYSNKIMELNHYVTAQSPSRDTEEALAAKEKEIARLQKDMTNLKMLASAKFRELEGRATRAMDHEEQARTLQSALKNAKAEHAREIAELRSCNEKSNPRMGQKNNSFRESQLQHQYEIMLSKAADEKNVLRKEVASLASERHVFLEKIRELEERDSSSMDLSTKMVMSENDALKREIEKLNKERKRLKGKLEYYQLI